MSEEQQAATEAAARTAQQQADNLEHAQLRAQLEEATLPLMLDAMWAANVLDIENTLRHVCKKVRKTYSTGYCQISVTVLVTVKVQCERRGLR